MSLSLSAKDLFDLSGWVAVVTGGGTGVGLMIAQTLASNGAKVYITGRREAVLRTAATVYGSSEALGHSGGSLVPYVLDVTDKDAIKRFAKELGEKEKYLNLMVNNAGVGMGRVDVVSHKGDIEALSTAMLDSDPKNWETVFSRNVYACFFASAAMLPLLAKASSEGPNKLPGSIVNIASVSGITKDTQKGQFMYNSSKAAVISLGKLLASELANLGPGPHIIRVNNIAPGYFPSEMTVKDAPSQDNKSAFTNPEKFSDRSSEFYTPFGTHGDERDMGQAILALACNRYINGQTLVVDGGWLLAHP